MLSCDLDIIGIAETHLLNDSAPTLDGYSAFSHNRTQIHKLAKVGSGGVSLLINNEIVESYNISILDNSIEDILWVRLEHKKHKYMCKYMYVLSPTCRILATSRSIRFL